MFYVIKYYRKYCSFDILLILSYRAVYVRTTFHKISYKCIKIRRHGIIVSTYQILLYAKYFVLWIFYFIALCTISHIKVSYKCIKIHDCTDLSVLSFFPNIVNVINITKSILFRYFIDFLVRCAEYHALKFPINEQEFAIILTSR